MRFEVKLVIVQILTLISIVLFIFWVHNVNARMNIEINNDECKIIEIAYNGPNNIVRAIGNCQKLYDMCTNDMCFIKEMPQKDLSFGQEKYGQK